MIVSILFFSLVSSFVSQESIEILEKIQFNTHNIEYIQYTSEYSSVSSHDDSEVSMSANVWFKKSPSDTIFGGHIRVKGKLNSREYDYYYDGIFSYEFWHDEKIVTIFDPYQHPNTPNNPAKTRVALSPFVSLIIDERLKNTLLGENPSVSIEDIVDSNEWAIKVVYPENQYGQILNRKLYVDKDAYMIKQIDERVYWRGITQTRSMNISNYKINEGDIDDNIYLTDHFDNYSIQYFDFEHAERRDPFQGLIGIKAPNFNYSSYTSEEISLDQFTGYIILLDFWETWCGYCILAMPRINELYDKYLDNSFTVIGITTENKQQVEHLIEYNDLKYPNIFADTSILSDYNVVGRPVYVIINQDGYIDKITSGNLEVIKNRLEELFGY
jgi:thiol-disulfide isomerase/thioredoxin